MFGGSARAVGLGVLPHCSTPGKAFALASAWRTILFGSVLFRLPFCTGEGVQCEQSGGFSPPGSCSLAMVAVFSLSWLELVKVMMTSLHEWWFRFAVCLLLLWTYQHAPHYCRIKIMSLTQLTERLYPLLWVLSVKYTWTVITLWLWPKAAFAQFLYSLQYFQLAQQHIWADSQDLVPKAWGVSCCITPGSLPKWHHAFLGFKQPQNEMLLAVLACSLGSPSSLSSPSGCFIYHLACAKSWVIDLEVTHYFCTVSPPQMLQK